MGVLSLGSQLRLSFMLIVSVAGVSQDTRAQMGPLSVCQALDSTSNRLDLVVRGKISGNWRHGFFVLDQGISGEPCPGWMSRFLTGPSFIPLRYTSGFRVELTQEQERLNHDFFRRLVELGSQGRLRPVPVTIAGVLVRNSWSLIFRRADGTYFGSGIDGPYTAVLVVKSIRADN